MYEINSKQMMKRKITIIAIACMVVTMSESYSQRYDGLGRQGRNVITTAVPSLLIGPDSRVGAMGEAGVALQDDINAQHWNPAKYAFMKNPFGAGLSYSPWLANLGVNDIYLAYLAGYAKVSKMDVVSFSLRYFSMGEMEMTNDLGESLGKANPHEFAVDAGYSRKLVDNLSMALSGRFIYSYLSNYSAYGGGGDIKPGMAGAVDIGLFYTKDLKANTVESNKISWGLCFSNIGSKISYSTSSAEFRSFIPANFRTGIVYTLGMDKYNKITFSFDLNKLMVPTPPQYARDSNGMVIRDPEGEPVIDKGRNPRTTSVAESLITSWFDAPGNPTKFKEEMQEFIQNIGIEYGYIDVFFVRTGFFNEAWSKGNRKYLTFGVGLKYSMFCIDASYILPVNTRNHPLENTLRFSLSFDFFNKNNNQRK
jgi:hypothetical protein